jgi:hypothetical protein
MKKNILFSTTRQSNPGDEFIFFGVRNLLGEKNIRFNTVVYNRHPTIRPCRREMLFNLNLNLKHDDNSWSETKNNIINYVVFAGTSSWSGNRSKPLWKMIEKNRLRFSIIGVGTYWELLPFQEKLLEENSDVLLTRDDRALKSLKKFGAKKFPCPALFASKKEKIRTKKEKIGIVFQSHNLNKNILKKTIEEYSKLIKKYNCEFICHHYQDLIYAQKKFPNQEIHYSSFSEDYFDIYDKFDLVIGTRVHGVWSCSLPRDSRNNGFPWKKS